MSYFREYNEHIEYTFSTFCKVVLRNAALSAYRDIGRQRKHEISLDYLMSERYYNPSLTDNYFEEPIQPTVCSVCRERIENERLAKAFSILSKQRQEVLVLYFFLDIQIRKSARIKCTLRILDGFLCPCCGVDKRAQSDRPLAPSIHYIMLRSRG